MHYRINHSPKGRIRGAEISVKTTKSAAEAWALVEALMQSGEIVTINSGMMGWRYLKWLAENEVGPPPATD